MRKILVGECKQEVSSFNPVQSTYTDFDISVGEALLDYHGGVRSEMAGALGVFANDANVEIIPAYSARAITSGGRLEAESFDRIACEFLETVVTAGHIDAVYLSMHGAMDAVNEDDPEGYLLQEIRKIVGPDVPIVISLDLHGILTQRMLEQVDALTVYHTYPHIDFFETGERAAHLLLRIMTGEIKPVMARVYVPALVRGPELITETGCFGELIRRAQALESDERGLAAGMFIGNPFTDVRNLATYSLVIADHDADWAEAEAVKLAQEFWDMRERLYQPLESLDNMVAVAGSEVGKGTVILVDAADATSSGASGDSNSILRALVENGYQGRLLTPIVDASAVEAAMLAGVGETIDITLGGQLDPTRFQPLPVSARVRMLSDGQVTSESHGSIWDAGSTAVLQVGRSTVIATSRAISLYDRSLFYAHGQDPKQFDAVVVKSPHCQEHMFIAWAHRVVNVDAPGSTSANLPYLGHTVCRRPLFPLDSNIDWSPDAEVFGGVG